MSIYLVGYYNNFNICGPNKVGWEGKVYLTIFLFFYFILLYFRNKYLEKLAYICKYS